MFKFLNFKLPSTLIAALICSNAQATINADDHIEIPLEQSRKILNQNIEHKQKVETIKNFYREISIVDSHFHFALQNAINDYTSQYRSMSHVEFSDTHIGMRAAEGRTLKYINKRSYITNTESEDIYYKVASGNIKAKDENEKIRESFLIAEEMLANQYLLDSLGQQHTSFQNFLNAEINLIHNINDEETLGTFQAISVFLEQRTKVFNMLMMNYNTLGYNLNKIFTRTKSQWPLLKPENKVKFDLSHLPDLEEEALLGISRLFIN